MGQRFGILPPRDPELGIISWWPGGASRWVALLCEISVVLCGMSEHTPPKNVLHTSISTLSNIHALLFLLRVFCHVAVGERGMHSRNASNPKECTKKLDTWGNPPFHRVRQSRFSPIPRRPQYTAAIIKALSTKKQASSNIQSKNSEATDLLAVEAK